MKSKDPNSPKPIGWHSILWLQKRTLFLKNLNGKPSFVFCFPVLE